MNTRIWGAASAVAAALTAGACSSNDSPATDTLGTGGASAATGGAMSVGGGAGMGRGMGGAAPGGTGGAMTTGGTGGTGGTAGTSATTGGASMTGGTGGAGAMGGTGMTTGGGAGIGAGGASGSGAGGTAGGTMGTGGAQGGSAGTGTMAGAGGTGMASGDFTINVQLASAVKSTAPTTVGIVTWSLNGATPTSAHIDFGLDTTYGMTAPVDLKQTDFRTLLLGMKPTKMYHFRIVANDGTKDYTSTDQTVTAGAKASANVISSFSVKNADKLAKGFFVTSFWQGGNSKVPFIFDTDGEVVWWYTAGSGESTDGVSQAKMSADGQSMWLVNEGLGGAPLRRVTMDGLTTQTYMNAKSSHAVCAATGDTMAYLDYSSGMSGCNDVYEINNAGTTKLVWKFGSPLKTGSFPTCHGNALRYSQKEDVYTYSDWQQDVVVVDRSGTVKWNLAAKTGGNSKWGGKQHGHQLTDNSLILFANDGGGANKSQAIEFGLDGSLIKAFTSNGSATNFGDVQRLKNGNTVITYSTSSTLQEVDSSDAVVLEVKGSGSFGYVEFRESLYGLPDDIQQ